MQNGRITVAGCVLPHCFCIFTVFKPPQFFIFTASQVHLQKDMWVTNSFTHRALGGLKRRGGVCKEAHDVSRDFL